MASPPSARTTHLRSRAHALCTAFTTNTPPTALLDQFFTPQPTITEHGPAWAQSRLPFLGKTFVGRRSHRPKPQTQTQIQIQTPSGHDNSLPTSPSASNPATDTYKNDEGDDATCDAYFSFLSDTLTFHPTDDTFPPAEALVVDAEADGGQGVVSVVGRAEFRSVRTGRGWVEEFIWRLGGWDVEGRVGRWEIWADPLSAWVAVGGEVGGQGVGGVGA